MSHMFPLITTRGGISDVARKGQTRDRKEMGIPHSFYEI
jgi:hypothetical protein